MSLQEAINLAEDIGGFLSVAKRSYGYALYVLCEEPFEGATPRKIKIPDGWMTYYVRRAGGYSGEPPEDVWDYAVNTPDEKVAE